jgi:hypothetical protein|nr:MAG TPA: hypothetical protein [Caudoviricetes sp.]
MKYKLLKDTPTIKAGAIFQEIVREVDGSKILKEYDSNNKNTMLVSEIKNFDEWFEEIKEPTDNIHWKPKPGEKHWYMDSDGDIYDNTFDGECLFRRRRFEFGNTYPTEEACRKAKERRLAEVRLQRTSNFEPDFEDCRGGWVVYYNYKDKELYAYDTDYDDSGEIVRYATKEEAEKSIRENREDWMKHFGVKE